MVHARLQQLWSPVQPHVDGTVEAAGYRPDPRMIQSGIHILDRLAKLYRLDVPTAESDRPTPVTVEARATLLGSLAELEARISPPAA